MDKEEILKRIKENWDFEANYFFTSQQEYIRNEDGTVDILYPESIFMNGRGNIVIRKRTLDNSVVVVDTYSPHERQFFYKE